MRQEQQLINIEIGQLASEAERLKNAGYRLVQICGTKLENFQLSYSFDKDYHFLNLRLSLPLENTPLPSISAIYANAFIYENELQDLFGIEVSGMKIDYKGKFYRTKIKWPYRQSL